MTPTDPRLLKAPTRAWTVRSWWLTIPGEQAVEDGPFVLQEAAHPRWPLARGHALHLTPCRGAVAVVVYDPQGDVFAHWDRFSNVAHHMWDDEQTETRARQQQEAWDEDERDRDTTPPRVD